jgi:AraC-like DNA-binding protein
MTGRPKELTDRPEISRSGPPLDLLGDVLSRVRLVGAIFLRGEYTAPWAYESPPSVELTRLLGSRADRLVLFHLIAEGRCWISVDGGERLEVSAGEIVVIPFAERHVMGSPEPVEPVPIGSLLAPPPWAVFPVIRHGGRGVRTAVVCGYLHCEDPIFDPVVRALPSVFSVRPPPGPAATWMAAGIQYALGASQGDYRASVGVAARLPELLFQEALGLYAESAPSQLRGWLAALHDPIVGPALVELHASPAHKWTIDELAARAACSRSTLNERFNRLLGRAPMTYLGEWRLHRAADLLRDTTLSVAAVAYRVGYESEEAFNRAFKRAMGRPPAQWRRHATAG